jgi:hypothetical protein
LAVLSGLLLIVAGLEARTLRQARAELQQLRTEREQAQTATVAAWAHQSLSESSSALQWLDSFYAEPTEGLGRKGGLCFDGKLDERAITSYWVSGFLATRAEGKSYDASLGAMRDLIVKSDQYRAVHPSLGPPAQVR